MPLFGNFGLVSQLGSTGYTRSRKFREKLEGWLNLVRVMWPECPAVIDSDGTGLFVDRSRAVLPLERFGTVPPTNRNSSVATS